MVHARAHDNTAFCPHLARPHHARHCGCLRTILAVGRQRALIARGAVSVQMLREDLATHTEFVAISWWDSLQAMAPGGDPHLAHHLPADADYLIELPERVEILRLLDCRERGQGR